MATTTFTGPVVSLNGFEGLFTATEIALQSDNDKSITLDAPASLAADYTLVLPPNDGSSGQMLVTDGSGVTTWSTPFNPAAPGAIGGTTPAAITGTTITANTGFVNGTSGTPISVAAAANISSAYGTTSAATGDTRLSYNRLIFTSTGSGETLRAFSQVTGVNAATGGTINGAHISLSVNGSGTISGAGNALRVTLGGSSTNPGGTLASIQLDSDFATGGTWTNASYIRCTNSGTGTIDNFAQLPDAMIATKTSAAVTHIVPIKNASGTTYYLMVSDAA